MSNTHEFRKTKENSPKNDFYQTPKCLTRELIEIYLKDNVPKNASILDCCCGLYAIGNELRSYGYNNLVERDLMYGDDYLDYSKYEKEHYNAIVINPPFCLFDKFVYRAKQQSDIVCSIGRLNAFGAHDRNVKGLWKNLKYVLIFDRQIAYDRPFRDDGKVECGMLISCWFIWDKKYCGEPIIKIVDVQKYIVNKSDKE